MCVTENRKKRFWCVFMLCRRAASPHPVAFLQIWLHQLRSGGEEGKWLRAGGTNKTISEPVLSAHLSWLDRSRARCHVAFFAWHGKSRAVSALRGPQWRLLRAQSSSHQQSAPCSQSVAAHLVQPHDMVSPIAVKAFFYTCVFIFQRFGSPAVTHQSQTNWEYQAQSQECAKTLFICI